MKKSIRSIVLVSVVAILSTGFAYALPGQPTPRPASIPPSSSSAAAVILAFFGL